MSNLIEITIPDIGDFAEVEVIEVLVAVGDVLKQEQSLITVESDKASMEIPSPQAGTVKSVEVKVGDKVKEGSIILKLEAAEAGSAKSEGKGEAAAPTSQAASSGAVATDAKSDEAGGGANAASEAASGQKGSQEVTVVVPDIGDVNEVDVIELLVAVGDTVAVDQSLITLESDKASMEVPSSHAGVVTAINVNVGDKVSQGSDILTLAAKQPANGQSKPAGKDKPTAQAEGQAEPAKTDSDTPAQAAAAPMASEPVQRTSPTRELAEGVVNRELPHASPSVRKFARELGVDLVRVSGSGDKGRITADDVRGYVKQIVGKGGAGSAAATAAGGGLSVLDWPKVDFSKFGPIESKPLSRIKKISGANLHRNWVMIPHVTNNDQADITDLEALRVALNAEGKKEGVKITMLAFIIKAVVACLKKFPEFNASLDGDNLVLKQYYHIGFAADTPNGLVVPVIRDADKKGVQELAAETSELAKQARDGKLSPAQMQGGCFSISSLGGIGGTSFTPIINAPEVAILGVSRSAQMPIWDGAQFVPRLMLPLSLSYDHRVIDGASAARFNAYLAALLADFRRIAL